RFTDDADLTVEPFAGRESEVVGRFGSEYYVSLPAVEQAVRERSSFNIIHPKSGFKIDIFVRKDRPFDKSAMDRRQQTELPGRAGQKLALVSPEDIVLFKLEWYRRGGEISDRQWSDLIGVLQVQGDVVDQTYLDRWAAELGVAD